MVEAQVVNIVDLKHMQMVKLVDQMVVLVVVEQLLFLLQEQVNQTHILMVQ